MNLASAFAALNKDQLTEFVGAMSEAKDFAEDTNVMHLINQIQALANDVKNGATAWTWRKLTEQGIVDMKPRLYRLTDGEPNPLDSSRKVYWIKWFREKTNSTLVAAKNTVEWLIEKSPIILAPGDPVPEAPATSDDTYWSWQDLANWPSLSRSEKPGYQRVEGEPALTDVTKVTWVKWYRGKTNAGLKQAVEAFNWAGALPILPATHASVAPPAPKPTSVPETTSEAIW